MCHSWDYAKDNPLVVEQEYPYTAKEGVCKTELTKSTNAGVNCKSYSGYATPDHTIIHAWLSKQPLAIAVAANDTFMLYNNGILRNRCGTKLNHAVTLVGYGTDEATGENYWLVKNSWGTSWGEEGYIRLAAKTKGGSTCGMYEHVIKPLEFKIAGTATS